MMGLYIYIIYVYTDIYDSLGFMRSTKIVDIPGKDAKGHIKYSV